MAFHLRDSSKVCPLSLTKNVSYLPHVHLEAFSFQLSEPRKGTAAFLFITTQKATLKEEKEERIPSSQ